MKLPKGKLLTLLAVFAAVGLVTATGAFTTVTAERTAEVGVSGDSGSLLKMEPHDGANGIGGGSNTDSEGYAELQNGELTINTAGFDGAPSTLGSGVNYDAQTDIQNVFVITNQGTQKVNVTISDADSDNSGNGDDDAVTFYNASVADHDSNSGLEGQNVTLAPGDSLVVSMYIDTPEKSQINDGDLIDTIDVSANATTATSTFSSS